MQEQEQFDRVLQIEDRRIERLLVRHLFAGAGNRRQPLTKAEKQELRELGIELNRKMTCTHNQAAAFLRSAVSKIDLQAAVEAFLFSLDEQNIAYRAVLRAYSIGRHLPDHEFVPWRGPRSPCRICGGLQSQAEDPVSAAHFVWSHGTCGDYSDFISAGLTINWFAPLPRPVVRDGDRERFAEFVRIVADAPPQMTAATLAGSSRLASVVGGNKYKRQDLMETLGFCGILSVPQSPGLLQTWTRWDNRPQDGEMLPPAAMWKRANGFNRDVFADLFPDVEIPEEL